MREYHTQDKTDWGAGVWQTEPDKVQNIDEATGYDTLIVRNHGGALCGYVGVPEGHAMFGKLYYDVPVSVHGGLTFASFCNEASKESWTRWREYMLKSKKELARYPHGDTARAWKETGHLVDDYEAWRTVAEQTSVCHVPEPGRSEKVWWLGFDCSHLGDATPAYAKISRETGIGGLRNGRYRSRKYVEKEIRELADQLKALA